jgi:hypothetical protein
VIDSTATCPSGYTALNWNQTGPAGLDGVSGYENVYRTASGTISAGDEPIEAFVYCPSGKHPIGGGGFVIPLNSGHLVGTGPFFEEVNGVETAVGWNAYGTVNATTPTPIHVDVYAVCATTD